MALVLDITRPKLSATAGATNPPTLVDADYLLVTVDVYSDDRVLDHLIMKFADYAGLQTEWEAGAATTITEAAIVTAWGARGGSDDRITSTQRGIIGKVL